MGRFNQTVDDTDLVAEVRIIRHNPRLRPGATAGCVAAARLLVRLSARRLAWLPARRLAWLPLIPPSSGAVLVKVPGCCIPARLIAVVPGCVPLSERLRGVRWPRIRGAPIAGPVGGGTGLILPITPLVTSGDGGVGWSIPLWWLVPARVIILSAVCGAWLRGPLLQAATAVANSSPAVILTIVFTHGV